MQEVRGSVSLKQVSCNRCAGAYHSCGVVKGGAADGQVECWGLNEHNQSQSKPFFCVSMWVGG